MTCKATVFMFDASLPLEYEGDEGGSSLDGSCWMMINDGKPTVIIPFSNIERVEYEYNLPGTPQQLEMEYKH